ncbi:MAG TPA: hypothetical protein PLO89_03325 [Spirochaetota bacterium]|nr:hypothetical protein [Spirochaetota bacterium]
MNVLIIFFAVLTLSLLILNILIARKIIKLKFLWHKRFSYILLLSSALHFATIFIKYIEDLTYILPVALGGSVIYLLLIIQILIGKNIIKAGIKTHRILGYVILFLSLFHALFALSYKSGFINFN